MGVKYGNNGIVTEELVFYVDAGNRSSYPGSGTTWADISGNDDDPTTQNNNTFPTFNSDGYFAYDKTSLTAIKLSQETTGTFFKRTLSVWFKTPSSFDSKSRGIFCMGGSASNMVIYINDNDLYMGTKASGPGGATTTIVTNTWYNATMVLDAADSTSLQADTLKLYVNGSSIGTASCSKLSISQGLCIGGGANKDINGSNRLYGYDVHGEDLVESDDASGAVSGLDSAYDGPISIAMVYDKALSATEVTQNYNVLRGRFGL